MYCFVFSLNIFSFLTDLKYSGRLIAGSLSALISKIVNPQVSHRHPLISILQLLALLHYKEIKCTVLFNSSVKIAQTFIFVLAALRSLMTMMMIRMAVTVMMMTMNVDADGHWLIGFTLARV